MLAQRSGTERMREVLGRDQADTLAAVPVAQINLWRPIREPVKSSPLALLDASTLDPDDHRPGLRGLYR